MSVAASPTPTAANPALGVALMVAAMLTVPVTDVIAKVVGEDGAPAVQVAWARFFFQALLLIPIIQFSVSAEGRRAPLWPRRPLMVAARGALIAFATCFFFAALQVMPLAETAAIFFVEPLILTLLSAFVLGETI
nr:EamA family transporter [Paracoccaceae bacterium]